jgi:hypothetical protein
MSHCPAFAKPHPTNDKIGTSIQIGVRMRGMDANR